MQYSVKLTMLMKTQIGQALWRDAIPEEVTEADHANDDRTLWSRKFASKKQNDLVENAQRYFRPAALPRSEVSNSTRVRQS